MSNKKRHLFSKSIVVLILVIGLALTGICVKAWWVTNTVDSYSLTALLSFWGGELLLLCIKRVLGDGSPSSSKKSGKINEQGSI